MNEDPGTNSAAAQRCEVLSRRVEVSCAILLLFELFLIANAAAVHLIARGPFEKVLWLTLILTGIAWLGTQILNYQLIKCGPRSHRFDLARRAVNRPEFFVRFAFHLVINWSAIAATLVVGFVVSGSPISGVIGYVCIAASFTSWLLFNLLHWQANRLKNIVLSSTVAVTLIVAALVLIAS